MPVQHMAMSHHIGTNQFISTWSAFLRPNHVRGEWAITAIQILCIWASFTGLRYPGHASSIHHCLTFNFTPNPLPWAAVHQGYFCLQHCREADFALQYIHICCLRDVTLFSICGVGAKQMSHECYLASQYYSTIYATR